MARTKNSIKLAEALLRRKELQDKVAVLQHIKNTALFDVVAERRKITDSLDDVVAKVPKLTASQVTAEYDFYARQLRLVDACIQQTNWTTDVSLDASVMSDFSQK